jgi:hypothetical protein
MASFNSLMSAKPSLLFKNNSLFRIFRELPKKPSVAIAVSGLGDLNSDPKIEDLPCSFPA